jgi:hypothetical protein
MDHLVSFKYPNGRTHEEILTTAHELRPGFEFDMYGRHWRIIGPVRRRPGQDSNVFPPPRFMCVCVEPSDS